MASCTHCGREVETGFRFCPWCAAPLRRKLVEFFPALGGREALRVSRYLGPDPADRQVRVSIWNEEGRVDAALSLDDEQSDRLAHFLTRTSPRRRQPLIDQLRDRIRL